MKCSKTKSTMVLVARILLALIFLAGAYAKLTGYEAVALASGISEGLIITAGVAELVGALLLVFGGCVHLGALILAVYLVVVTVALHLPGKAWESMEAIMKNAGLLGGMLLLMANGGGCLQVYKCKCDQKCDK